MARSGELTDTAWGRLMPLLPKNGHRGKQWRDHREVIDGILWRPRTGAPWCDVPARYEKRTASYRAVVVIASILIWLGM